MNILHVGYIENNKSSGVANVVPKYLEHQSKIINAALYNLEDFTPINSRGNYLVFLKLNFKNKTSNLPPPFNKPDLVIFHEIYRYDFIRLSRHYRKMNIPYIIVPHSSLTNVSQKRKKIKKILGNIFIFNRYINNASAIHYLSEEEKNISKLRNMEDIVVGNGIDIPLIYKKSFSEDGLKIIYIGRLDIVAKGLDILLEAINLIKDEMLARKIIINISGPDQDNNLKSIMSFINENKLEEVVNVDAPIYGNKKVKKLLQFDCFIQLSRNEGQPLGLLEAMSLSLPPIATPGTSLYHVIKKHDLGFPVICNSKKVSEKILYIHDNLKSINRYSINTRIYILKNHNWTKITQNTVSEYKRLLKDFAQ